MSNTRTPIGETTFTIIAEQYIYDEWPDSRAWITTVIEGDLADKVRAFYGKQGRVTYTQHGEESGYSDATSWWEWDAHLFIGDEQVWGAPADEYGYLDPDRAFEDEAFSASDLARHLVAIARGEAARDA